MPLKLSKLSPDYILTGLYYLPALHCVWKSLKKSVRLQFDQSLAGPAEQALHEVVGHEGVLVTWMGERGGV